MKIIVLPIFPTFPTVSIGTTGLNGETGPTDLFGDIELTGNTGAIVDFAGLLSITDQIYYHY